MRKNSVMATSALMLLASVGLVFAQSDTGMQKRNEPAAKAPASEAPASKATPSPSSSQSRQNPAQTDAERKTGLDRADQAAGEKGQQGRDRAREVQNDKKSPDDQKAVNDKSAPAPAASTKQPASSTTKQSDTSATKQGETATSKQSDTAAPSRTTTGIASDRANVKGANTTAPPPQLSSEKIARFNEAISRTDVRPATNVNFSLTVGIGVPSRIRLYPLSAALVSIAPEYRGYSYFVVEDRIVIVQPRTRRIVTVIDRRGGQTVGARTEGIKFNDNQRRVIRERAMQSGRRMPADQNIRLTVGEELPQTYVVEEFPAELYTELPEARPYRYVIVGEEVVLVEPTQRRIVEIVR